MAAPTLFAQNPPQSSTDCVTSGFAEKFAEAEKKNAVALEGADGWLFLSAECRLLSVGKFWGDDAFRVSRAPKPETADPVPAIEFFCQQLKARGIDLILVPVPPKASIYPDKIVPNLTDNNRGGDAFLQRFYDELRTAGVDVLDLTQLFRENRVNENGAVFCKTDTHWSGVGCVLAARAIAEKIRSKLPASPTLAHYVSEWKELCITGDLPALLPADAPKPGPEKFRVRCVSEKATGGAVAPDVNSRVLLLGDSHTLVFHDFLGERSGLIDQLALELGETPDLIGIRGSGATQVRKDLYRRSIKDPNFLAGKKVIVWCFTAREFTEADQGWQQLPVARPISPLLDSRTNRR